MSQQCPCGLAFEILDKHTNTNGRCRAEYVDENGTSRVCNRPLVDHPHNPASKNLLSFSLLFNPSHHCQLTISTILNDGNIFLDEI
jgi:hypothetical protein